MYHTKSICIVIKAREAAVPSSWTLQLDGKQVRSNGYCSIASVGDDDSTSGPILRGTSVEDDPTEWKCLKVTLKPLPRRLHPNASQHWQTAVDNAEMELSTSHHDVIAILTLRTKALYATQQCQHVNMSWYCVE